MGHHEQKLWLILDEAEKKLLRAKHMVNKYDEYYVEIINALEKIKIAKEKLEKELDI